MSEALWVPNCDSATGALAEQGVWVCDDAVSTQVAQQLRSEILGAHEVGLLKQSGNKLAVRTPDGGRGGVVREKPHVFEADVIAGGVTERPEVLDACPVLKRLLSAEEELRKLLNAARPELSLDRLEQAKIQVNSGGGGAFPMHFDVPAAKDSRRVLTAILYLNPEWQEGDGGEVETLPFPFATVATPPLDKRLVVFSSLTTMHRVRPFHGAAGRVCINLWFEGDVAQPFPEPLPLEDYDARATKVVRLLRRNPQELRAFCKVWYQDEITISLRDAFAACKELEAAIVLHMQEADEVESRIARGTLDSLRACLPLEPQAVTTDLTDLFDGFDIR